jgi:hypothetical protein
MRPLVKTFSSKPLIRSSVSEKLLNFKSDTSAVGMPKECRVSRKRDCGLLRIMTSVNAALPAEELIFT